MAADHIRCGSTQHLLCLLPPALNNPACTHKHTNKRSTQVHQTRVGTAPRDGRHTSLAQKERRKPRRESGAGGHKRRDKNKKKREKVETRKRRGNKSSRWLPGERKQATSPTKAYLVLIRAVRLGGGDGRDVALDFYWIHLSVCPSVCLTDCVRVCLTVCVSHPARIFVSFNVSDICTRLSPPLLRVCLQQSFPTTTTTTISHLSPFHFFPQIILFF